MLVGNFENRPYEVPISCFKGVSSIFFYPLEISIPKQHIIFCDIFSAQKHTKTLTVDLLRQNTLRNISQGRKVLQNLPSTARNFTPLLTLNNMITTKNIYDLANCQLTKFASNDSPSLSFAGSISQRLWSSKICGN